MPMPSHPHEEIAIDFQGPFPPSQYGAEVCDFLYNVIDTLTGEVIMIPTQMDGLTAKKCAEIFLREVYPHWGVPRTIRSDRDVRFVASLWKEFCNAIGTTLAMTTSGRASSNGKVERMHRNSNAMMRQHVSEEQTNWAAEIKQVQFAINTTMHSSTGYAPFALSHVQAPTGIPSWSRAPGNVEADDLIRAAQTRLSVARDTLHRVQAYQTHSANKHRRPDQVPEPSNLANLPYKSAYWVSTADLGIVAHRSRKWAPNYTGPFPCLAYDEKTSLYLLSLPARYTKRGISPLFHASKLKLYVESDPRRFPGRLTNPVPIFPLDTLEMDVASIRGHFWKKSPSFDNDGAKTLVLRVMFSAGNTSNIDMPHADLTVANTAVAVYLRSKSVSRLEDLADVRSTLQNVPISFRASELMRADTCRFSVPRRNPPFLRSQPATSSARNATPRLRRQSTTRTWRAFAAPPPARSPKTTVVPASLLASGLRSTVATTISRSTSHPSRTSKFKRTRHSSSTPTTSSTATQWTSPPPTRTSSTTRKPATTSAMLRTSKASVTTSIHASTTTRVKSSTAAAARRTDTARLLRNPETTTLRAAGPAARRRCTDVTAAAAHRPPPVVVTTPPRLPPPPPSPAVWTVCSVQ